MESLGKRVENNREGVRRDVWTEVYKWEIRDRQSPANQGGMLCYTLDVLRMCKRCKKGERRGLEEIRDESLLLRVFQVLVTFRDSLPRFASDFRAIMPRFV